MTLIPGQRLLERLESEFHQNFQSMNIKGLYPAGEGAGYAGGILSAGVDGIKVAEAVALDYLANQS